MQRQQVFDRERPSEYWAVLSEAALYKEIGGAEVMADQLCQLVKATKRPGTTIQVLPFASGAHPFMASPFTLLSFEDVPGSVVYIDYPTGSIFLDEADNLQRQEVQQYAASFRHLTANALPSSRSVTLIAEIADRMSSRPDGEEARRDDRA